MNDTILTVGTTIVCTMLGTLIGWNARAIWEARRRQRQIVAWQRTRKFFSSNANKN